MDGHQGRVEFEGGASTSDGQVDSQQARVECEGRVNTGVMDRWMDTRGGLNLKAESAPE